MAAIRMAIIGMGKIARDQHLPSIEGNADFVFTASVSPNGPGVDGIPHFKSLEELIADGPKIDAVALCTPPQVRYDLAATALEAGLHVFLEKPPGATLSEVAALEEIAAKSGVTLFASWHSRFAPGVESAKAWIAQHALKSVAIVWREDVRVWHPGQAWIWEAGGLGVFDPGINALSIATYILPKPFFLKSATLSLPANRAAPIAADLAFRDTAGTEISMDLDWRQTGPQSWDISVETDAGTCKLSSGGAVLELPGADAQHLEEREYPGLYERFATLVHERRSEVDTSPLRLVADAFLSGKREIVEAFDD